MDKKEIQKLWTDKTFPGSFSGLQNFQKAVEREKNVHLTINEIRQALLSNEIYLRHVSRRRRFPRRSYEVSGFGK